MSENKPHNRSPGSSLCDADQPRTEESFSVRGRSDQSTGLAQHARPVIVAATRVVGAVVVGIVDRTQAARPVIVHHRRLDAHGIAVRAEARLHIHVRSRFCLVVVDRGMVSPRRRHAHTGNRGDTLQRGRVPLPVATTPNRPGTGTFRAGSSVRPPVTYRRPGSGPGRPGQPWSDPTGQPRSRQRA